MDKTSRGVLAVACDSFCTPQLAPNDTFRFKGETFAQTWKRHIEFILSETEGNSPMDVFSIY